MSGELSLSRYLEVEPMPGGAVAYDGFSGDTHFLAGEAAACVLSLLAGGSGHRQAAGETPGAPAPSAAETAGESVLTPLLEAGILVRT